MDFGRGRAAALVQSIHDLAFAAAEMNFGIHVKYAKILAGAGGAVNQNLLYF